jgi:hypothetical protein
VSATRRCSTSRQRLTPSKNSCEQFPDGIA